MNYAHFIREIGRGREGARDLTLEEAQQLYGAMLDGGVPELEMGGDSHCLATQGRILR